MNFEIENEIILVPMIGLFSDDIKSVLSLKLMRLMNHKIITQIKNEQALTLPIKITKMEFSKIHDDMNEQECRALKRATNGLIEKNIKKIKGKDAKKEIKICQQATFQKGECSSLLQPSMEYLEALLYCFSPESDEDRIIKFNSKSG